MTLPLQVHLFASCKPAVLLHGLPQKELGKELELELVPFLRQGTGGGTSSNFCEGTGTGTSSFLKGTLNCLPLKYMTKLCDT